LTESSFTEDEMSQKKRSDARRITLKFEATCKACQTVLKPGSKATWYPGGTVYGADCHVSPFQKKAAPQKKVVVTKSAPKVEQTATLDLTKLAELLKQAHPSVQKAFLQQYLGR
jgi:hypothetical protein